MGSFRIEKLYAKVGNRLLEVDRIENNVPIIKADAKEIGRGNGRTDVVVKVPYLQIVSKTKP